MTVSSISRVARTRLDDPPQDDGVHEHVLDRVLQLHDVVERDDGPEAVDRVLLALAADDLELLLRVRVPELRLEEERSSCASGSGKVPSCSIGFSVAMRKKGDGTRRVVAVNGHLVLGHRLEQR